MSNNHIVNEKKKALLAYKEQILDEIKHYERSIDEFRTNYKNKIFYDDADSSDSEDEFPYAIDTGPTIPQLKLQQAMLKTCLQATQELTSLTVLQSEVNVLVEVPQLDGERPVTEPGTWTEVTAECRIDLVPFTITFYMHTPDRKFAPPSYRGLRVVPVKYAHEMELAKSVLHTLKLPSDVVEVIRSYAAGYRSRRTTLARLSNKYASSLFMEPHPEGGFVLKCADLLEVSWRLENKWSPVAPFHHRMKFDLEYMDESYIKIITQAHKQLLDPSIQTDERTLLLAKIISTCLEARGPVDQESDLESKTTERDTKIDKRDNDIDRRDSEVMAPPKSLPKKSKNNKNVAQKRSLNDDVGDSSAKRMKNDDLHSGTKTSNTDVINNPRKSKISDIPIEGTKRSKMGEISDKNKDTTNFNSNNIENQQDTQSKNTKNFKEPRNIENGCGKIKVKNVKSQEKVGNSKPKNKTAVEPVNIEENKVQEETKIVNVNEIENNQDSDDNNKLKDKSAKKLGKPEQEKDKAKTKKSKETYNTKDKYGNTKNKVTKTSSNTEIIKANVKAKPKNADAANTIENDNTTKETGDAGLFNKNNNIEPKNVDKKNTKDTANAKSNDKTVTTKVKTNEKPESNKNKEKVSTKEAERLKSKKDDISNTNNLQTNSIKPKSTDNDKIKSKSVTKPKNDEQVVKKVTENVKNPIAKKDLQKTMKEKTSINKVTEKIVKDKQPVNLKTMNSEQTIKKITEKQANNNKIKDKISQINNTKAIQPEKDSNSIFVTKKSKEITNSNNNNKKLTKDPKKTIMSHKLSTHRNSLKAQNPPKALKAGNTKIFNAGNTEKENGGNKISKIPQKKFSPLSDSSSKHNFLRISPRKIPSKFKSSSQENMMRNKLTKNTNIPRLLKKPGPKSMQ